MDMIKKKKHPKPCKTSICPNPKGSFYMAYLLLKNGYSQLGPQTSIGVIVTNKRERDVLV